MHTQGNWNKHEKQNGDFDIYVYGQTIAKVLMKESSRNETIANAAIIAAAPELLAAVENLLSMPEYDGTQETSRKRRTIKRDAMAALAIATNSDK